MMLQQNVIDIASTITHRLARNRCPLPTGSVNETNDCARWKIIPFSGSVGHSWKFRRSCSLTYLSVLIWPYLQNHAIFEIFCWPSLKNSGGTKVRFDRRGCEVAWIELSHFLTEGETEVLFGLNYFCFWGVPWFGLFQFPRKCEVVMLVEMFRYARDIELVWRSWKGSDRCVEVTGVSKWHGV